MKSLFLVAFLTATAFCSGCFSVVARYNGGVDGKVYPAIRLESETVAALCEWESGWIVAIPFCLDFPFSAVCDTICMPYDAYAVDYFRR